MNDKNFKIIIKNLKICSLTKNIILTKHTDNKQTITKNVSNKIYNIKKSFKDENLWKIFINVITESVIYHNSNWYIMIKIFIKKYYENSINYIGNDNIIKSCKDVLDVITTNFKTSKKDMEQNGKKRNVWLSLIDINDAEIILKQKNKFDMYEQPRNWIYIDKKNVYLDEDFNKSLLSNGKFIQNTHIKALYNPKFVDMINELQKIYHKLDLKLFTSIFSKYNLLDFYQKKDKYNKHIEEKYYLELCNNYKKYNFESKETLSRNLSYHNIVNLKEFKKLSHKIITPSEKIVLNFLYNYNNEKIYNNLVCDYRGRLYIQNVVSYISSKLYRFLITLNENYELDKSDFYKYYIAYQHNKKIKSINEGIATYENWKTINDKKNILLDKINIFHNYTISLDATSSMLQIISLICKNYKLMKYTNLIPNTDRLDIYDYIINKLEKTHEKSEFINHYTNRNLVKYSIMLYIYGSSPLFTAQKLCKEFDVQTIYYKDLTTIINNILTLFKEEFKSVTILKKIIRKFLEITNNDETTLIKSIIKEIEYSCPSEKKIIIKSGEIYTEFYTDSLKPSIVKKKKSTFVNLIHTLDSEICIMTRYNLYKENIYTLSIHDCFITHINNYQKLLIEYNKNIYKIYDMSLIDMIPKLKEIIDNDNTFKKYVYKSLNEIEDFKNQQIDHTKLFYTLKPE